MKISIEDSFVTFDSIKGKQFYPSEFDEEIQSANVVILPENEKDVLFPEFTTELFQYLHDSESVRTSISISDDDFKKIEKHCDLIDLGIILVTNIVLPFVINLLTNFLYDKLKSINKKDEDVTAELQMIVEETKSKKSKKVTYKGPIKDFEDVLKNAGKDLFND